MMNILGSQNKQKIKLLFLGALVAFSLLVLTGSVAFVSGAGRFQIESWGYSDSSGRGRYGAFVIDTVTGEAKIVYQAESNMKAEFVSVNSLGKHFNSYDSKRTEPGLSIKESNKLN